MTTSLQISRLLILLVVFRSAGRARPPDSPAAGSQPAPAIQWHDLKDLVVEGRGWEETKSFYDRLPARAEGMVRKPVWNLSRHSAGMCARFVTDATEIHARWSLTSRSLSMPHMPATGVSGIDLYVRLDGGRWRWLANGKPASFPTNETVLASGLPPGKREYLLYLPLYNGVSSVEVGIPGNAALRPAPPRGPGTRKPLLFYGTSITQGGCASRPGMAHPAILGRWLNYPVINLGFSGNGRMEPEMASLLAELDPSVYVLDCLPNMNSGEVAERVPPFVETLRRARPATPILLVEDRSYADSFLVRSRRSHNIESRAALRKAYFAMKAAGVKNLHYLPGDGLLGADGEDTVDGSHPTDLGFLRQAEAFRKALLSILEPGNAKVMNQEWRRSHPDIVVYLPRGTGDGDNEHFLVFEAPGGEELLALWTQSSVEGRGDNRIVLARSLDGESWSQPIVLAGKDSVGAGRRQASWAFPVVSRRGRIYCFFNRELARVDERQASGAMGCLYSDDSGHTWTGGGDLHIPRNRYDHPDPSYPRNWIVFQKPIRDGRGHWIAGYTQVTSTSVKKRPSKNWPDADSRSGFIRFENIDENPLPEDLRISWLPTGREGLEVPHRTYPEISVCQEPSLALLPDGRLFVVMRTMTGYIWYSLSGDGGATWREPEVLRFTDGGERVPNPIAPDPIYSLQDGRYLLLFFNNPGKRGAYDQFKKKWNNGNQLNFLRNPAYIAIGEFRPRAHQPIWFSRPRQILDTDGVVFGPKGTAEIATYTSFTRWRGKGVLWYPDRKHFLLGKYLTGELLDGLEVPEERKEARQ